MALIGMASTTVTEPGRKLAEKAMNLPEASAVVQSAGPLGSYNITDPISFAKNTLQNIAWGGDPENYSEPAEIRASINCFKSVSPVMKMQFERNARKSEARIRESASVIVRLIEEGKIKL
jgi:hypothetical protein